MFVVASDAHVQSKLQGQSGSLPFKLRHELAKTAVKSAGEPWMLVDDSSHAAPVKGAAHSEYFVRLAAAQGLDVTTCDCFIVAGSDHRWVSLSTGEPKWRTVKSSRRYTVLLVGRGGTDSEAMLAAWGADQAAGLVHPSSKHVVVSPLTLRATSSTAIRKALGGADDGALQPSQAQLDLLVKSGDMDVAVADRWMQFDASAAAMMPARWDSYEQNDAANSLVLGHPILHAVAALSATAAKVSAQVAWINSAGAYLVRRNPQAGWEILVQDPSTQLAARAASPTMAYQCEVFHMCPDNVHTKKHGNISMERQKDRESRELAQQKRAATRAHDAAVRAGIKDPATGNKCRLIGGYRRAESLACKILAMRSECWHEANVALTSKLLCNASLPGFYVRDSDRIPVIMVQVFELDYEESCRGELRSRESGAELGWVSLVASCVFARVHACCSVYYERHVCAGPFCVLRAVSFFSRHHP